MANDGMQAPDPDGTLARARRLLAAPGSAGAPTAAESASGMRSGPPGEQDRLDIASRIRAACQHRPPILPGQGAGQDADAIAADIVARAGRLLEDLRHGASATTARDADVSAFEAVLRVRGRPALRVQRRLEAIEDASHPGSGFWRPFVNEHESRLLDVAAATGAVMAAERQGLPVSVRGTAWLVEADLVVTNRHVLFPPPGGLVLARRRPEAPTQARILSHLQVVVDFAHDNGPARQLSFLVEDVPFVSPEDDPIDVALLRVRPAGAVSEPLPAPLQFDAEGAEPAYLYVVGHPGPAPDLPEKAQAVFGSPDGRKRVSLGAAMQPEGRPRHELWHDASTIGGYSGGCVFGFGRKGVAALHYRGHPLGGNRAFTAAALRAHAVSNWIRS